MTDHEALLAELAPVTSMTEALRWAAARRPPAAFLTAVAQDEFTFDVVVRVGHGIYVVFDTT